MKALLINYYTDQLQLSETELPETTNDEVLVRVYAASVNHIDYLKAEGVLQQFYPLNFPWIPGRDFAGVVVGIGKAVTLFKVGDAVYGDNVLGGAYAEFVTVNQNALAVKPETVSFEEAASIPVSAETAYQALFEHAKITESQTVLIAGAAGSVGGFAIQLAKLHGAKVIAFADEKYNNYLTSLGADSVVNTLADGTINGVDVAIDLIGGEIQHQLYKMLKKDGVLIATNLPPQEDVAKSYGVRAFMMHQKPTREGLTHIARLIDEGKLTTAIATVYPLEKGVEAWERLKENYNHSLSAPSGKTNGKIVLSISEL
ncbi:MAG: NADP-dependent oxidoreductase [Bacteroidetes bacterium]|nr:MAG: NADP-dependent oxidoreductase [Bacteroidota bacterium]